MVENEDFDSNVKWTIQSFFSYLRSYSSVGRAEVCHSPAPGLIPASANSKLHSLNIIGINATEYLGF